MNEIVAVLVACLMGFVLGAFLFAFCMNEIKTELRRIADSLELETARKDMQEIHQWQIK